MTKTNTAGYVAAFPIPEVMQGINAFTRGHAQRQPEGRGARSCGSTPGTTRARSARPPSTLISQGADVVTHHTDSTAAVQAAEAKGVYAVGYHSDMSKFGPKAHLTAITHNWGAYYTKVAQSAVDGKWKPGNVWGGIKDGMIKLAPFNGDVPKDVQDQVEEGRGRHRRRQAPSVHRPDQGQRRQGAHRDRQDARRRDARRR